MKVRRIGLAGLRKSRSVDDDANARLWTYLEVDVVEPSRVGVQKVPLAVATSDALAARFGALGNSRRETQVAEESSFLVLWRLLVLVAIVKMLLALLPAVFGQKHELAKAHSLGLRHAGRCSSGLLGALGL